MPLTKHPFGYQQSTNDYLLARLIITKKFLEQGEVDKAKACIEDIIQGATTRHS